MLERAVVASCDVVTVKVAERLPAGTVTVPGTCAAELLDPSVTVSPPAGAWPVSVTVAVEVPPPRTAAGLRATD
jgi:hypothetical protein